MINIPRIQTLICRKQHTNLHLMRIITSEQKHSRDYLQGTLRMLNATQPCSSWSSEWPFSACSPCSLYCASLYLMFAVTLLFQLGQCLHTFSFYLHVTFFVFRLLKRVLKESFSSPGLCAHLGRAYYIKCFPEISLFSLVCISCIKNLV